MPDKRPVILVIDDELQIRQMLDFFLGMKGFEVLSAGTGQEALKIFEEKQNELSMVLLDRFLPDLSGEEILKAIRKSQSQLKVLLVSGQEWNGFLKEDPYTNFIGKPFEASELENKIREFLYS